MKSQYCTLRGRSSPRTARRLARCSSVASSGSDIVAGSVKMWVTTKTREVTTKITSARR